MLTLERHVLVSILYIEKQCFPVTPLGECDELTVNEVFLQGFCDAMIMAWNLIDAINKGDDVVDHVQ